jgi:hypothetical protein
MVHKILEVSQQFFFTFYYIFELYGQKTRRSTCATSEDYYSTTSNWAKYSGESYLDGPLLGTWFFLQDFQSPSLRARSPMYTPASWRLADTALQFSYGSAP